MNAILIATNLGSDLSAFKNLINAGTGIDLSNSYDKKIEFPLVLKTLFQRHLNHVMLTFAVVHAFDYRFLSEFSGYQVSSIDAKNGNLISVITGSLEEFSVRILLNSNQDCSYLATLNDMQKSIERLGFNSIFNDYRKIIDNERGTFYLGAL